MHFRAYLLDFFLLLPVVISAPASNLTPRTCPSTIIKDGSFESGIAPTYSSTPWTIISSRGLYSYTSLTSPGSPSAGKYAFTVALSGGPYDGTGIKTLAQNLTTCAGTNYSITADWKFESAAENQCSLAVVYPFQTGEGSVTTSTAIPGLTPGVWFIAGAG
ncbi:MAG: hypothetical protein Q9168_007046, partial [Polycauliona sp. 1 TL-2023]